MATDITDLVMLQYKIKETDRKIELLQKEKTCMQEQLVRRCFHPTTTTNKHYCSGGYDYVSCVTINIVCTICKKIISSANDPNHKGTYQ